MHWKHFINCHVQCKYQALLFVHVFLKQGNNYQNISQVHPLLLSLLNIVSRRKGDEHWIWLFSLDRPISVLSHSTWRWQGGHGTGWQVHHVRALCQSPGWGWGNTHEEDLGSDLREHAASMASPFHVLYFSLKYSREGDAATGGHFHRAPGLLAPSSQDLRVAPPALDLIPEDRQMQ